MKTISAVLLALTLLALSVMPAVSHGLHAAPTAKATPSAVQVAPGIYLVRITRASMRPMQPMQPRTARTASSTCMWYGGAHLAGGRYSYPDYVLQAALWVLVYPDYTYCGKVYSAGYDRLLNNCHNFEGWVGNHKDGNQYSYWSAYHCTHTEYTFSGPITSTSCPSGYALEAVTGVTDDPWNFDPHIDSAQWAC